MPDRDRPPGLGGGHRAAHDRRRVRRHRGGPRGAAQRARSGARAGATLRVLAAVKAGLAKYGETEARTAERRGKDFDEVEGELRVRAEEALRRATDALDGDVPVEADTFVEDPADVLIRVSEHLDLLVCGSRGYGPLRAVLLGGVSRRLTAEAQCPVIVLPRGVTSSLEALMAASPGAASRWVAAPAPTCRVHVVPTPPQAAAANTEPRAEVACRGTTITGQAAERMTWPETPPRSTAFTGPYPREPITRRSTVSESAIRTSAGLPE